VEPGYLRLLNNRLADVRLGDSFVAELGKIVQANKGGVAGCYHSLVANDNEWFGANNEMIAINVGLSMNVLQSTGEFGTCITNQGKYQSNFAHGELRLLSVGGSVEAAANGGLNVVSI
jgi:hypothetical protein